MNRFSKSSRRQGVGDRCRTTTAWCIFIKAWLDADVNEGRGRGDVKRGRGGRRGRCGRSWEREVSGGLPGFQATCLSRREHKEPPLGSGHTEELGFMVGWGKGWGPKAQFSFQRRGQSERSPKYQRCRINAWIVHVWSQEMKSGQNGRIHTYRYTGEPQWWIQQTDLGFVGIFSADGIHDIWKLAKSKVKKSH